MNRNSTSRDNRSSLVNKSVKEFKVIVGSPAKVIKDRKKNILDLEKEINNQNNHNKT